MGPMKSDYQKQLKTVTVITLSSLIMSKLLPIVKYSYFIIEIFIAKLTLSNSYI
jgi:hypothetical protein